MFMIHMCQFKQPDLKRFTALHDLNNLSPEILLISFKSGLMALHL